MLLTERPHGFRRRLEIVHHPDRRDPAATPEAGEFAIGAGWSIVVAVEARVIVLATVAESPAFAAEAMVPRGHRLLCGPERVIVCRADARGGVPAGIHCRLVGRGQAKRVI